MTLIEAHGRGLLTDHEFCVLSDIDLYAAGLASGELVLDTDRPRTRRRSRCLICHEQHDGGLNHYWLTPTVRNSYQCGWRNFCDDCLARIHDAVVARSAADDGSGAIAEPIRIESALLQELQGVPRAL